MITMEQAPVQGMAVTIIAESVFGSLLLDGRSGIREILMVKQAVQTSGRSPPS
jgi:hypothetical protein